MYNLSDHSCLKHKQCMSVIIIDGLGVLKTGVVAVDACFSPTLKALNIAKQICTASSFINDA